MMMAVGTWMYALGYMGGIITTAGGIPQLSKMCKTKQTSDLSWAMLAMWFIGLSMTTLYGIAVAQPPVYMSSTVSLVMTGTMMLLKMRYDREYTLHTIAYTRVSGGGGAPNDHVHPAHRTIQNDEWECL